MYHGLGPAIVCGVVGAIVIVFLFIIVCARLRVDDASRMLILGTCDRMEILDPDFGGVPLQVASNNNDKAGAADV